MKSELFLPASSPESVGIPSSAVLNFIERIDRDQICMHGFLLLRKGQIAAEGYWSPYSENSMHRMYSVSKSFVALAIGLMVDEGKINLDDQVVKFFKDKTPQDIHPYLAQATIRDLLMMATPHTTTSYTRHDSDWAATFFNKKPSHPPGTIFSYDTSATVILGTIVERKSGVPFLEYMRERLLDPIGFSRDAWCIETPEGTSWGGSGVICTLRDMAKLAYVCMNKGRWNDLQLISEQYINAATSKQIDNSFSDNHGYGYQIWMEKDNGFAFRGMGSQLALCFPGKDLLFACIADTQGAGTGTGIDHAFREEIFSKIEDSPLPYDAETNSNLNNKIENLKIIPQQGKPTSSLGQKINGKWYHLNENPMGISKMRFIINGDEGRWEYENASGEHQLTFGIGKILHGVFPQKNYFGERIGTIPGRCYDCLSSAAWVEEHKLNMLVYITDIYLGTLKLSFSFKENEISIYMTKAAEWFLDEYTGFAGGFLAND
ncbi:serine hydrolase [Paenibacillus filicis]|uniref:Serine hydrolase n=1 Tax=Paenibacillus gyeongsangnamensis TaxID=3388067 RepID=A0ABT4QGP6_9BACL|nr:serine hydrolase [Paenibacillus filicis]MCZ8516039.1 serine hydrolase [Paenibacillus filicis]